MRRTNFSVVLPIVASYFLVLVAGMASPKQTLAGGVGATSAADLGVVLVTNQDRLFVARVTGRLAGVGLRAGDQIVAVNGRRVASERAFVGRLTAGGGANILVNRNGSSVTISAGGSTAATQTQLVATGAARSAPAARAGWLNPANMVITADGRIMHKDVAARLGLESRPLSTVVTNP